MMWKADDRGRCHPDCPSRGVGSHDRPWCNVLDEAVINFQPCVPHNITYPLLDALQLEQKRRSNASAAVVIAQDYMKEKEDRIVDLLEELQQVKRERDTLRDRLDRMKRSHDEYYRMGIEAAIRVAEKVWNPGPADTVGAIKKLLGPQESYEAKWQRLGYYVRWSETEPRMYEVSPIVKQKFLDGDREAVGPVEARLPTVQEVDKWVGEHPR